MYCKNCGAEIDDNAVVCPKCGVQARKLDNVREDDAPSTGFAVLGFFFPLIGLILYLVWKDESPLKAKSVGKGALIGVIVSAVLGFILGIVYSCAVTNAIKNTYGMIASTLL